MTEKETQEKTSQESSDETKNTENSEEQSIPKASYDAVAEKYKAIKAEKEELEAKIAESEKATLKEKEDFKKLAEKLEAENNNLKLEGIKRDLIQEAITSKKLHPIHAKLVVGTTEEEIKQSLEDAKAYYQEMQKAFEEDRTATDNSSKSKPNAAEKMSQEEFMELYDKDPEAADKYLSEITNA